MKLKPIKNDETLNQIIKLLKNPNITALDMIETLIELDELDLPNEYLEANK